MKFSALLRVLMLICPVLFSCKSQVDLTQIGKVDEQTSIKKKMAEIMNNSTQQRYSLINDQSGNIWLGTVGEGIYRKAVESKVKDEQTKAFIHYYENNGLEGNVVYVIHEDNNGIIWVGTNSGLSRFDGEAFRNVDPRKNDKRKFDPYELWDYRSPMQYVVRNISQDKSGMLWFSINGGTFCFDGKQFIWPDGNPVVPGC